MNSLAIHPAFAVDYARALAVEARRDAERARRARALRSTPESTPAARRRWFTRSPLRIGSALALDT